MQKTEVTTLELNNKSILEALIFAAGEPVEKKRLAQTMEISENEVEALADELKNEYNKQKRGFQLIELDKKYQLCSRAEYFSYVKQMLEIKRNAALSQAAFEVLAVIAYNQPVTKSFVEQVRGVDCSGVIASLYDKGLIEEKGRLELPGRPLLYGTTDNFLRCFSISSLQELPPLPERDNLPEAEPQVAEDEAPASEGTEE